MINNPVSAAVVVLSHLRALDPSEVSVGLLTYKTQLDSCVVEDVFRFLEDVGAVTKLGLKTQNGKPRMQYSVDLVHVDNLLNHVNHE